MSGFREFLARGNVLDLAVAVIIGAAFGAIVTSLTEDVIMPAIGAVLGDMDFANYFVLLGPVPADFHGDPHNYAALKAAGVPMLGYGAFISAIIKFVILAFVIYQLVKMAQRMRRPETEEAPAGPPEELVVLREIRDELKNRPSA
jgi:large conductance mechanosensitive channel